MLRREGLRLVLTFYTTADAIATERLCKKESIPGRLIPVPRELTSDCGMAWSMAPQDRGLLEEVIKKEKIEVASWTELML